MEKKLTLLTVLAILFCLANFSAMSQVMVRVAGTGIAGNTGDGGPALNAEIFSLGEFVIDSAGNIYVADAYDNVIRKISTSGTITQFAGNGTLTNTGDGGQADTAGIGFPWFMAIDKQGNLYVTSQYSSFDTVAPGFFIRKISTAGIISSVFGSDTTSIADLDGLAVDAYGNLFIADGPSILKVNTSGVMTVFAGGGTLTTDGNPATADVLNRPYGMAFDTSGNMYFLDPGPSSKKIKKIDVSGILTTYTGNGTDTSDGATLSNFLFSQTGLAMIGMACSPSGELYFTDGYKIRMVSTAGIISTVAGNGTAGCSGDSVLGTTANIDETSSSLAFDRQGNLFFMDIDTLNTLVSGFVNGIVRKVNLSANESIQNISIESSFAISPNPSTGIFTLTTGKSTTGYSLNVCNYLGQAVCRETITGNSTQINLTAQPAGIYFVRIANDKGDIAETQKIIKQ